MLEKLIGNKPFEYKKLTEAEQQKRGILGRLVGIIADTKNPTRNGRHYSEQLWENVFENPIMKEKIANKCCFGELNHPADRTETDMEKIAICLSEQPKLGKDGKLYGVFDILNTPCGKILKALCDYGCNIGISSRGQGDLVQTMDGEEVDPDTYDCECFDAVLVPGVEQARLKYVTESLQKINLRKALNESLKTAKTDDEMRIMKEQLEELNLINESDNLIDNEDDDIIEIVDEEIEESVKIVPVEAKSEKVVEEAEEEVVEKQTEEEKEESNQSNEEESAEETIETEVGEEEMEITPEETESSSDADVFLDFLANNFDEDKIKEVCKILDIKVENSEEEVEEESTEEVEETSTEETTEQESKEEVTEETSENASDDIDKKETEETKTSEALDIGSKVLVNSLKEALKAKSDLETQVQTLQEKLAASDARVNATNEECTKYKSAISRLSLMAKSSKDLKENVSKLEEELNEKNELIESQKERIARLIKSRKESVEKSNDISESIQKKDAEISKLNESVTNTVKDYQAQLATLNEKLNISEQNANSKIAKLTENLNKATKLKESYKDLANKAINKYIEIKADTLGVTSKDIKRKLGESYTIEDVDQVCEDLKSYQLNISKLPFNVDKNVSIKGVKVNEANANKASKGKAFDDDSIDDVLFKIANIDG